MKSKLIVLLIITMLGQTRAQCPLPGDYRLSTQAQINDFLLEYPDCEELDGNLTIGQFIQPVSTDINDLTGFKNLKRVNGDFRLREVDNIELFDGLQNIEFIGGDLYIASNDNLRNLSTFEKLDSIMGDIRLSNNSSIDTMFVINTINYIGGAILILDNQNLKSIDGLKQIKTVIGNLEIVNNPLLVNLNGLNAIMSVNGKTHIYNTGIVNLNELSNLTQIYGWLSGLSIANNISLESIVGLDNLSSIDGFLKLKNNPKLASITPLDSLHYIGGFFEISESVIENFNGLENVKIGMGSIVIMDNQILTSLDNLNIHKTVHGNIRIIGNENLVKITSLIEIDSIVGGFSVFNNTSLTDCSSICRLLKDGYVENPVIVSNNLEGCNSIDEITIQDCFTSTVEIKKSANIVSVSPNPVIDELGIYFSSNYPTVYNATLYNSFGEVVEIIEIENNEYNQSIDMSRSVPGLYMLLIKHEKGEVVKKILKYN